MKTRNLLMGAALALIAPLAFVNVGCGEEPAPVETDAGQVGTDGGTADDAGTNGGTDAGEQTDAGTRTDGGTQGPTNSSIWFFGDYKVDNKYSVGRHDLPAGETTDLGYDDLGTSRPTQWDVSADGTRVVLHGARTVAGRLDLLLIDSDGTVSTLVEMASTDGSKDVIDMFFSPDGSKVLFRADYDVDGQNDVYVVPTAGGTPVKVSPDRPGDASNPASLAAISMAWSATGKYVAIVGDLNVDRANELYIADVSGATPTIVTGLSVDDIGDVTGTSPDVGSFGAIGHPAWSGDDRVVFKARKVGQTNYSLYSVKADGTDLQRVANSPVETVDVGGFAVSPDGKLVAYTATAITDGAYEMYVLPLDGSAEPTLLSSGEVAEGRSAQTTSLTFSPDNTKLAFIADYDAEAVGHMDLYVAPVNGKAIRLVALPQSDDKDVDVTDGLAWAPDSSGIAFAAEYFVKNDIEVFRTADLVTPDQEPITVQRFPAGGDAHPDVYWTPQP